MDVDGGSEGEAPCAQCIGDLVPRDKVVSMESRLSI